MWILERSVFSYLGSFFFPSVKVFPVLCSKRVSSMVLSPMRVLDWGQRWQRYAGDVSSMAGLGPSRVEALILLTLFSLRNWSQERLHKWSWDGTRFEIEMIRPGKKRVCLRAICLRSETVGLMSNDAESPGVFIYRGGGYPEMAGDSIKNHWTLREHQPTVPSSLNGVINYVHESEGGHPGGNLLSTLWSGEVPLGSDRRRYQNLSSLRRLILWYHSGKNG